jgi:hypothetical protein
MVFLRRRILFPAPFWKELAVVAVHNVIDGDTFWLVGIVA